MTFIHVEDMVKGSPLPGWSGRFFHSENMTFARWTIDADAQDLHEHQHPNEEVWNVVGGHVTLVVDGVEQRLGTNWRHLLATLRKHTDSAVMTQCTLRQRCSSTMKNLPS